MRAAIIIIFFIFITLCLISGQVLCFRVFGCSGGSLMFKCTYKNQKDQYKEKYFCRDESCKTGISTKIQNCWVYKERLALYDNENSRFFTVFIRNLSREDDGKYTCGNSQTWSRDVELKVNDEPHCGTSVIQDEYIEQTITVRCEYDDKFKTHTKVFYSLNGDPVHVLNSSRSSGSSGSSEEKFILSDSREDHFTVTIRAISAADSGVYLCGVERDRSDDRPSETSITHMTFIKEIHLNVSSQMTSVQVQAYSSKSVFITCTFPQEFKGNKKFIQKDSAQKILVNGQNQWKDHNNVLMFDDSSEGLLKVILRDLTAADEGTYRCGVNINDEDLFTEVKLTVNTGDHFRASSNTSAIIGESVNFTCNFPEKHDETSKHFCKENKKKMCESISSSEKKRFEFSVSSAGVFTVSISDVSLRDAGVYWCGAETRHTHLTSVSLTNRHKLTPTMVGREGGSSEIRCPYDESHSTEVKHLCKGTCFSPDSQRIAQSDEAHVNKPKISVNDETELNLFTVTLSDLRAEDAGIYRCAVKDAFNLPIELMIVMKEVITHKASVGGSVSFTCKSIRKLSSLQRSFCRGDQPNICVRDRVRVSLSMRTNGRFSLTDETSAGVFTVTITNLTEEDSGKYWCAEENSGSSVFTEVHLHVTEETTSSDTERETNQDEENSGAVVIVVVSVGLILLAVFLAFMLLKIKSNKHGIISSSDRREAGDHEVAQEEIQDSDPASTPLDSSVQVPTIPSDGLLYASVSFQKHEESLSDATAVFSKDQIHSEYASVKHSRMPN